MKAAASKTNKGGGVAGKADRLGGAAGHAKYKCPICAQQGPDMKTMQARSRLIPIPHLFHLCVPEFLHSRMCNELR